MIIDSYDIETEPILKLEDFYGPQKFIVEKCLIIFSKKIHEYLIENYECTEIGRISSANGDTTIYKMKINSQEFAFYLSAIGSALASTYCCEANWLTGARKFIMFGSCGSLDKEKTFGKYIIPTESYRGEGSSYYYASPASYIDVKNSRVVTNFFEENDVPHVVGKVWTTDSMLRETVGLVNKRKSEGCIAVEMELAGVQAVSDFYGFELYCFLESGDVLSESNYEVEWLRNANHDLNKLYLAFKLLSYIDEKQNKLKGPIQE